MKKFDIETTEVSNNVTIDWIRFSVHARHFAAFASWLNIPTKPEEWGEMKRFNKVYGLYLMDGVAVYSDVRPTPLDDDEDGNEGQGFGRLEGAGPREARFIVDFSGSGLANWYKEMGDSPLQILEYARQIHNSVEMGDVRVNRLDLAFDDHAGFLELDKIERYLTKTNLTVTRWEKYQSTSEHEIRGQDEEDAPEDTGETIYLGSRLSNSFARIYDKLKEMRSRMNREERRAVTATAALPDHWIRFELELKREHAAAVANGLLNAEDPSEYALGVLRGKIDFKSKTGDKRIRRRDAVRWWERFTRACAAVPIRVPRPVLTLERIKDWVDHSVAPSLAVIYLAVGGGDAGDNEVVKFARAGIRRLDEAKLGILRGIRPRQLAGMAHGS